MTTYVNLNVESQTEGGRLNILRNLATTTSSIDWSVDRKCWQMYNNYIDTSEFDYLTKVGEQDLPARFVHYPAQRQKINFLVGRQLDRTFQFSVSAVDKSSLKDKREKRIKFMVDEYITRFRSMYNQVDSQLQEILEKKKEIEQSVQQKPENEEQQQAMIQAKKSLPQVEAQIETIRQSLQDTQVFTMENIKKLENLQRYTNQDYVEITAQKALKAYIQKLNIKQKGVQEFTAGLVTGKERFYVDYRHGDKYPIYRALQGHNVFYQAADDVDWIEDLDWAGFEEYMAGQDVILEWGLTGAEKETIENFSGGNSAIRNDAGPFVTDEKGHVVDGGRYFVSSGSINQGSGINVKRVWWVAERQVKAIVSPNKHRLGSYHYNFIGANDRAKTIIDKKDYHYQYARGEDGKKISKWILDAKPENTHLAKEYDDKDVRVMDSTGGDEVVVRYMYDRYKGAIINNEIFKAYKDPIQPRSVDNYSKTKLPIIGATFNNMTNQPYSLIWATKELQRMIDVVSWHKELMLALSGTKSLLYDITMKPIGQSDREFRYNKKLGDVQVQTRKPGVGNVPSNFNQWQVLDLSLSDSIQYLDKLIDNLDSQLGLLMGVTRPSMGQISKDDQVGTFQMSQQSVMLVTEVLYAKHDEVERRALSMLMNLAKQYIWTKDTIMSYVDENSEEVIVDIPAGLLNLHDFDIILSTGTKEERSLNEMKQFALQSFSKGSLPWQDFLQIYSTDSLREAVKKSEYFSQEVMRLQKEAQQSELKNEAALQQQKIELTGELQKFIEGQKRQIEQVTAQIAAQRLEFDKQVAAETLRLKDKELDIKKEAVQVKSQADFSGIKVQSEVKDQSNKANEQIKLLKVKLDHIAKTVQMSKANSN